MCLKSSLQNCVLKYIELGSTRPVFGTCSWNEGKKKHIETRLCIIFQEFSNFLERLNLLQLWNNRVSAHFEWLLDWVTASTGASGDFVVVNPSFCSVPTFTSYFYMQKKMFVLNTIFIGISNSQFLSGFNVPACISNTQNYIYIIATTLQNVTYIAKLAL